MHDWIYQDKEFLSEMIEDHYGFVYLITNLTNNRKYIGRKYFHQRRKKKVEGKKRKKKVISESNWKDYWGSCEELLNDIKIHGQENFTRQILSIHKSKMEVNYTEVKEQFLRDVLYSLLPNGEREYYNSNILSRYFASRSKKTKK